MKALHVLLTVGLCLAASPASADPATDATDALRRQVETLTRTVQQLTDTVQSQQERIVQLEGAGAAPPPPADAPASQRITPRQGESYPVWVNPQASAQSLSAFNPEIGVLADVVGEFSESSAEGEGNDKLTVREVEVVFGHAIDPYSRLDVTVAVPELEAVELEEAYITHWGFPEVKTRLGRFIPKAGKAVAIHRDSLDTVDEPLVVQKYFGVEGWSRTGIDATGFLPVPWTAVIHELTAGVMEGGVGEGGALFGETRRRPSAYAHLKNFWEISDETNAELGLTYLTGSKDDDSDLEVQALGMDATLVHYLTPTNKVKFQNELYLQDRDESFDADEGTEFSNNPFGWYSLRDVRLSPRIGVGGRFDYVEPIDGDPALLVRDADTAWSAYLTFYQSEFARWRLQYRHTDFALGGDDNTFFLQGTVAIGVHKHQIQ